ncbi:regulatory protein RecX [Halioxenophilus sp. WMMB6]|uniref:regulatory protein RecX n=1 Tax=Halioxenophilus sp. WMMB6 TaxID=3073815 RepID=UPI00295E5FD5|nr:regulatory protein RecX [Halioxenophilus sp. WMMB6]
MSNKFSTSLSESSDLRSRLRNYALTLLARRDYPSTELAGKLTVKFGQQLSASENVLITETCAWLEELGYVNNVNYCRMFIEASQAKGRGRLRIVQDLKAKKLPNSLIESVMQEAEADWQASALAVARRKFRQPPESPAERAKVFRFLQYRGFNSSEITEALNRWRADDDLDWQ